MANVWIGFHDHADSAPRWIDSRVSYTWLRAFERCEDVNLIAFLREYNYNYDVEHPIRGVRYKFRTTEISAWVDEIVSLNPSLILYNCCWYNAGAMAVEMMRDALKDAIHVIRIHHQVTYLAAQPGFRDFLLSCDVAIAPTAGQMESVRDLGFDGHLYSLPFGINAEAMRHAARPFESRDIHLASAANYHPARNLALVEKVYERLRARGRRVENFSGLPTAQLAEKLGRTKVFWQTSMTEASGSRILPEAIAAGCYPIVFDECLTNRDLILRHGSGTIIVSNIVYDYKQKINTYPDNILEYLTENLDRVISEVEAAGPYVALPIDQAYEEENEINRLTEILHKSEIDWRKPRFNWRSFMNVPVDPDGYAFNPTFFKSALGLVCIYRHVDSGGLRTLRRCLLDSNFGADDYVVWSDELKMLGTDVEWFADPRAFQVGSNFYISFNTGHSESPNHIYIVQLDEIGAPITSPMKCEKRDGRREFEKNWGMFCVGEKLYAIYSISPFVVLCIDFIDGLALASPVACHIWDSKEVESQYGELHGGAAPVIIGDLGYYVAQAKSDSVAGPIYRGTVLTFEAKPPFRPVAVAPRPLFTLSIDEMRAMPEARLNPTVTQCFYPCGALYDETDASITISYGINDYRAGCRNYDLSRLEKSLRPVRLLTQSSSLSS